MIYWVWALHITLLRRVVDMALDLTKLTFENLKKKIKREPVSFTAMLTGATFFVLSQFVMPNYGFTLFPLSISQSGKMMVVIPLSIIIFIITFIFAVKFFEK